MPRLPEFITGNAATAASLFLRLCDRLSARFLKRPFFFAIAFWAVIGGVVLVLSDCMLMPVIAGHLKFTEEVPNVVGLAADEAEARLRDAGLKVVWNAEGRWSSNIPAGHVLTQTPESMRVVKKGRSVHLTASKGTREVPIPDLRGNSLRQAEISLNRLGLVQGRMLEGAHTSLPRGVVIRTQPDAGKVVRMGSKVDIVVSAGASSGKTRLPDFKGKSLEETLLTLDSLGFQKGPVERRKDSEQLPNTVLDQRPRGGEYLEPGFAVDLVVAE